MYNNKEAPYCELRQQTFELHKGKVYQINSFQSSLPHPKRNRRIQYSSNGLQEDKQSTHSILVKVKYSQSSISACLRHRCAQFYRTHGNCIASMNCNSHCKRRLDGQLTVSLWAGVQKTPWGCRKPSLCAIVQIVHNLGHATQPLWESAASCVGRMNVILLAKTFCRLCLATSCCQWANWGGFVYHLV